MGDLSLFIDPFLISNNSDTEYQELHEGMIKYLTFLRDKTLEGELEPGLLDALYRFAEVKQTWLGFSATGNKGSGLGKRFANSLSSSFQILFSQDSDNITKSRHIEKVCLLRRGVGKDNISDFTTNLIKEYLLRYTEDFAKNHLQPEQLKKFSVPKVRFNYDTESWETMEFELPAWDNDYIILVPRRLLTRDDTWINRSDLIGSFEDIAVAMPDDQMRASLNNYFTKRLPKDPKAEDRKKAAEETIEAYPQMIDYYIKIREESGDKAVSISEGKVLYAQNLFLEKFTQLAALVADTTSFYSYGLTTLEDTLARVECLKDAIEVHGGSQFLYSERNRPVSAENELQILQNFLWFNSIGNAKALSTQKRNIIRVEFKLATNKNIKNYLAKKDEDAVKKEEENLDVKPEVTVVFAFFSADSEAIQESIRGLKSKSRYVRLINAGEVAVKEVSAMPQKNPKVLITYSHD